MFTDILWIVGKILIGLILGLVYKDFIKRKLYKILVYASQIFGRGSKFKGLWEANFKYIRDTSNAEHSDCKDGEVTTYKEVIELYECFGYIIGEVVPHQDNTREIKQKSLRIFGKKVEDSSHLTGDWYHPHADFDYHGAFQFNILPNNQEMIGQWIGFNTKRDVHCNEWEWKKIED